MSDAAGEGARVQIVLPAIAEAARRVLTEDDWSSPIRDLLAILSGAMQCSAAFIRRTDGAALCQWVSPDAPPMLKTVLKVPVTVRDAAWGTLDFGADGVRQLTKAEAASLAMAAGFIGAAVDRMEREARLREREALLRETLDNLDVSVVVYDAKDRYVLGNRRYHERYPHLPPEAELVGRTFEEMIRAGIAAGNIGDSTEMVDIDTWIAQRLEKRQETRDRTNIRRDPDGTWTLVKNAQTANGNTVTLRIDVTDHKRLEDELVAAREVAGRTARISARAQELRSALNDIAADLALLAFGSLDREQHQIVSSTDRVAKSLLAIVEEIESMHKSS